MATRVIGSHSASPSASRPPSADDNGLCSLLGRIQDGLDGPEDVWRCQQAIDGQTAFYIASQAYNRARRPVRQNCRALDQLAHVRRLENGQFIFVFIANDGTERQSQF